MHHKPAQYNKRVLNLLDILWWLFVWPVWLWIKLEERQAMRLMAKDQRLKFKPPIVFIGSGSVEEDRVMLEKMWGEG